MVQMFDKLFEAVASKVYKYMGSEISDMCGFIDGIEEAFDSTDTKS